MICFSPHVTLKVDRWPWKIKEHLTYATSSSVHHFVCICEFKLELLSRNAQFGSKSAIFCPTWPWNLTDDLEKQQDTSFMLFQAMCIMLSSSVNSEVTVRKRPHWGKICFDLRDLDRWSCPFAWTMLLSMVITPSISWLYYDRNIMKQVWQSDGRTETFLRAAWSQLKIEWRLQFHYSLLNKLWSTFLKIGMVEDLSCIDDIQCWLSQEPEMLSISKYITNRKLIWNK